MRRLGGNTISYDDRLIAGLLGSQPWRDVLADMEFTLRERQVLESFFFAETEALVAKRLGISPRTVEKHVRDMCEKVGARSRTRLLTMALALTYATLTRGGGDK